MLWAFKWLHSWLHTRLHLEILSHAFPWWSNAWLQLQQCQIHVWQSVFCQYLTSGRTSILRRACMMDEVYINQEADPSVLETDGTLDLAWLNVQPASIVINRLATSSTVSSSYKWVTRCQISTCAGRGLVDAQTSKTKQSFTDIQQNLLHDFVAGSKTLYGSQEHLWQVYVLLGCWCLSSHWSLFNMFVQCKWLTNLRPGSAAHYASLETHRTIAVIRICHNRHDQDLLKLPFTGAFLNVAVMHVQHCSAYTICKVTTEIP